jgi:pimeloyl-ACP methyl ester carboxylesterase
LNSILFLHGIRLGAEIWKPHAALLEPRFHVVALDLPGHGALADVPFTQATITELLDTTIAQTCDAPPVMVGYSLGGFAAMYYTSRRPERTRGLVLSGCTIDFESWKYWPYGVSSRLSELMPDALFDALTWTSLHITLGSWAPLVAKIPFNREVIAQVDRLAANTRTSELLRSYGKPVLFLNGEYDLLFRIDERRYLRAAPQAELRIIRGAAHTAPMMKAEEFANAVGEFAGRVFATPAA